MFAQARGDACGQVVAVLFISEETECQTLGDMASKLVSSVVESMDVLRRDLLTTY